MCQFQSVRSIISLILGAEHHDKNEQNFARIWLILQPLFLLLLLLLVATISIVATIATIATISTISIAIAILASIAAVVAIDSYYALILRQIRKAGSMNAVRGQSRLCLPVPWSWLRVGRHALHVFMRVFMHVFMHELSKLPKSRLNSNNSPFLNVRYMYVKAKTEQGSCSLVIKLPTSIPARSTEQLTS